MLLHCLCCKNTTDQINSMWIKKKDGREKKNDISVIPSAKR